jgi:hypothetical protein
MRLNAVGAAMLSPALCVTAVFAGFPTAGEACGTKQIVSTDGFYTLRWQPKTGEVHYYQVNVKFDYGGVATLEFKSELKVKVTDVAANGNYTLQTLTTAATIVSGEEVKALPEQPPTNQYYTKMGIPTGPSLHGRDPDPFEDLLDHLTEFQSPPYKVRLKDQWVNRPTGPKTGIFSEPRLSYTFVDAYKEGARHFSKIRYQASIGVDPDAASGTLILDRSNNYLSEVNATIPHFRPENAKEDSIVTISVKEKPIGVK